MRRAFVKAGYTELAQYEERTWIAPWALIFTLAATCVGTFVACGAILSTSESGSLQFLYCFGFVALGMLTLNSIHLTIQVLDDSIYIRFGYFFPMFWRRIPLRTVSSARAIVYRPLRDAGGWGLRFGRYESRYTTFYTIRGNEGVLLQTERRQIVVGSSDPESLATEIERHLKRARLDGRRIQEG